MQTQKRREALLLLQDARRRGGGTAKEVREAYINLYGAFVLDLPLWLEEVEMRLTELLNRKRQEETAEARVMLSQKALERVIEGERWENKEGRDAAIHLSAMRSIG